MTKHLYPILILSFILSGCKCEVNVSGVVLDLYTHEPILGANVLGIGAGAIDMVTDTSGYFEFEELSLDDCEGYSVKVQAIGYSEKTVEITNGSHIEIRLDTIF